DERGDARLVLDDEDLAHSGLPASGAASTHGRSRVKTEPTPGTDSTATSPPWARAIASTIASPRPAPSVRRDPGARPKRSKIRPSSSGAIPTPWSRTHNRIRPCPGDPAARAPRVTVEPGSENLTAFAASWR